MINKIKSQTYQKHTQSKAKVKTKLSKNAHKREQKMSESDGDNSLTYESHLSVDIAHENKLRSLKSLKKVTRKKRQNKNQKKSYSTDSDKNMSDFTMISTEDISNKTIAFDEEYYKNKFK